MAISYCLKVKPTDRPSPEELISMPSFMGEKARRKPAKRANSHAVADSGEKIDLLKTIKMPRNLNQLNKGLLPKEKYTEEEIKADTMKSE